VRLLSDDGLYLGVDIGTSSSKAVLMDDSGAIAEWCSVPHGVDTPAPGRYEQDAEAVWWADAVALTRELLARPGVAAARVRSVAVSGIGPCVLPLGENGPLRSAILYGIDSRAAAEAAELAAEIGDARAAFDSQSVLPKLRWLQRHEPEVWERTRMVLGCGGYLVRRLTGENTLDLYEAGSYFPARCLDGEGWESGLLAGLGLEGRMPRLLPGAAIAGRVTAEAAAVTGLLAGTPVAAPAVDAAAEATGAGVGRPGDLMLMYGSTGFLIAVHELPGPEDVPWRSNFFEAGVYSSAAGTNAMGTLVDWFRGELGGGSFAALAALAGQSVPGARGVLVLPYWAGERTPVMDPHARGVIAGLSLRHGRADVYRGVVEGIAYGIRHAVEALHVDAGTVRAFAVGGGANNALLLQSVSDATGIAQRIPRHVIGAAYGDALRAATAVGVFPNLAAAAAAVEQDRVISPRENLRSLHDERFGLFLELSRGTALVSHALADREGEG
jgi:xylulokinase